jgi:tetratricopeptide (TPR) repeat protein
MKPESIVFAIAGMCFGILLGWVIATQHALPAPAPAAPPPSETAASTANQPPTLDEGRVQALRTILTGDPQNEQAMVQLANTYFDAERWNDAIEWYERALKVNPNNTDASTDLGVSYFYTNRPDHALAQFAHSLTIDPTHTKTLLNKGIVLAFGKEDLKSATEEWKKTVELAPDSPEGQQARKLLEGVAAAHAQQQQRSGTNQ